MRNSRTERGACAAAGLACVVAVAAVPAAAQPGPPVPLLPTSERPSTVPAPIAPTAPLPPTAPAVPSAAKPANPRADAADIRSTRLAPTDASWAGQLGGEAGAFPQTMWRGTARPVLAAALPLLAATTSPTLQNLARRLLLSNAASPLGSDDPSRPGLATLRLGRLLALGDVGGAVAAMDQLPADPSGDAMDRLRIELRFAANDTEAACRSAAQSIDRYQNPWWDRAMIACQALAGDHAKAALGLSLLRERKAPPDLAFDALIDALGGHPHKFDKLPDPSPLRLALLAAAAQPMSVSVLDEAGPAALLAYAGNDHLPLGQRLAAAERAALFGALPLDTLADLYGQVEAPAAASKDIKLPDNPKSRALAFQAAQSGAPGPTRPAAIAALLTEARKRSAFPMMARLLATSLAPPPPATVAPGYAGDVARALLVAGRTDAAQAWVAASGSKVLRYLNAIATQAPAGRIPATLAHDAVGELVARNEAAAPAQADLLLALGASFDPALASDDRAPLLAAAHEARMPSAALWFDQLQAAADARLGETVLTSVLLVQAGDKLALDPILLSRAIAGLRAVGLETEARALALEAAVDAGL